MIVNDEPRRPQSSGQKPAGGWTTLHSWIFLVIVAIGLFVIAVQNRYHYLSPVGLGKAYRIDKLFGGIQEFEPSQGWIKAELQLIPPLSMAEPQGSQVVPMHMPGIVQPGTVPQGAYSPEPSINMPSVGKEDVSQQKESKAPSVAAQQQKPKDTVPELTSEEKFSAFKRVFPNFGKDEFLLANDDLYPDWKKNIAPNGTWNDFLNTYREFIQWWDEAGSPAESGVKLWKEFLASTKKR